MELKSIIIDSKCNVVYNNLPSELSKLIELNIGISFNKKILLANILEKNYTLSKIQLKIDNSIFNQYIFEEWRICSIFLDKENNLPKNKIQFDYKSFNVFEQEVIFALLSGYGTNKDIELYLNNITGKPLKGNLKHIISMFYVHFNSDNRSDLIKNLIKNGYDKYLPVSLFPPGYYNLSGNNNKLLSNRVVVF